MLRLISLLFFLSLSAIANAGGIYQFTTATEANNECKAASYQASIPYGVYSNNCNFVNEGSDATGWRYTWTNGELGTATGSYYYGGSCPAGTSPDSETSQCVAPPCPANSSDDGNGGCTCNAGTEPSPFVGEGCIAIECDAGKSLDPASNKCIFDECTNWQDLGRIATKNYFSPPNLCVSGCVGLPITAPELDIQGNVTLPYNMNGKSCSMEERVSDPIIDDPSSVDTDTDGDGKTDAEEELNGTDPNQVDTDNDGIDDTVDEMPLDPDSSKDSDRDGIPDELDDTDSPVVNDEGVEVNCVVGADKSVKCTNSGGIYSSKDGIHGGLGSGSGEGGGDDKGACDPRTAKCGRTSTGGDDCVTPPTCSGDAVDCGVLKQSWLGRCKVDRSQPELNTFAGKSEIVAGNATGPNGQFSWLPEETIDLSADFDDFSNQTGAGGTCPGDYTLPLMLGSVAFSFQPMCDVAYGLNPLVLLLFTFIGARIVLSGLD
jgi:hypothetical protein